MKPRRFPTRTSRQRSRSIGSLLRHFLVLGCVAVLHGRSVGAATPSAGIETALKEVEQLRQYTLTRGYSLGRPTHIQCAPDGKSVLFLRSGPRERRLSLHEFDAATGQTRELLTPEQVLLGGEEKLSAEEKARRERMRVTASGFTDFQMSPDGGRILLSLSGKLYLFERAAGAVRQLPTSSGTLLDPKFSPDGKFISYVLGQDVHTLDLKTNKERRVTKGGTEQVSHGLAEFVAQEEMDRFAGYWWSPDSKSIAFEEADATGVEVWRVSDPAHPETESTPSFYPRPGKANVKVRLGIIPKEGGWTVWAKWDEARFPYLAQVRWSTNAPLTLVVQSRDQKELALLRVNEKTGATQTLLNETDAAWVNLDQQMPRWLADGSAFLWTSERSGAWELELRHADGRAWRRLAEGAQGYKGLLDVDDKAGIVTFLASADPTQAHVFRVPLMEGASEQLTREVGQQSVVFAKNHTIQVNLSIGPESFTVAEVRRKDGTRIGVLPSVAEEPPQKPKAQVLQVGDAGFYAEVVRPVDFQNSKRYPVLVDVYGGPHAQVVQQSMGKRILRQWLADQGFIVAAIDGRGTPGRGRDWERAIAHKFGSVPLEDQVAGLKALGEKFQEMDLTRAGIVGWSFGGYMSALAVLRAPEAFKAGVAGAPVTEWRDYDTHYTERYMGLLEEHAADYDASSLLTHAAELRRPLLLVHGTTDDNVYFRHTVRLGDALFRAGRHFEVLPLSGFTHMVPDPMVSQRLWERIVGHFKKHLGEPH